MGSRSDERRAPLLGDAARAFEEHEQDLLDRLVEQLRCKLPEAATVGDAIEEMNLAAGRDRTSQGLVARITAIMLQNPGGYLYAYFGIAWPPPDSEPTYRLSDPPLSHETLELWGRLTKAVDKLIPPGRTEAERDACIEELVAEHDWLSEGAARLEELLHRHGCLRARPGEGS